MINRGVEPAYKLYSPGQIFAASFLGTPLIGSVAWSPADGALPSLNVDSGATGNLIELIGTFRVGLAYAW